MKKKLIATVLSLTLAVSGVCFMGRPVPAQAAGQGDIAPHASHYHVFGDYRGDSAKYYEEANSTYHYVYVDKTYRCLYCDKEIIVLKEQVGYEEHTMWGVAPSPHRASCLQCGYLE